MVDDISGAGSQLDDQSLGLLREADAVFRIFIFILFIYFFNFKQPYVFVTFLYTRTKLYHTKFK